MAQYANIGGDDILIGYNHNTNQIQFKNLTRKTNDYSISLVSEGPKSIPEVVSFYYHNQDSLFILSLFSLSLVDAQGNIKWIDKINREGSRVKGMDYKYDAIWCDINHGSPIYFDDDEGSIYFAFKPYYRTDKRRFQQSPCGKLRLSDFSVERLPIFLPEKFRKNYYGPFEEINFLFQDDRIIYCSPLEPTIYSYDKNSGKIKEYDFQLKYTRNFAPPLSPSIDEGSPEVLRYFNENPRFFPVLFNGTWYYRCHMTEYNPTTASRNKFVTIFDTNFNLVLEAQLPKSSRMMASNIPTPSGLLLYQQLEEREDIDQYIIVNAECDEI